MNMYDSARMADLLRPLGYDMSPAPQGADMVILNTCHIREKASEKVFSELGRLRPLKDDMQQKKGRKMILAVAGCVAQAEGEEIVRRAPYVDMVFGPQSFHRLPEMVAKAARGAGAVLDTDFPAESKFDFLPEEQASQGPSAFLAVQEGCDKFCTFCVVPYTRGAEYSRPAADILQEARRLIASGAKEITLLGQNVNAYHGEAKDGTWSLARLIEAVAALPGIARIRYTTSHPKDMTADLIEAHRDIPQLMPYLHLPVQSGSDAVLDAMNRKHRAEDYLKIIEDLRAARPDIALSSDFIVGFPGESEKDFEATMDIVRKTLYAQAYSFKYSPRPGTPASVQDGQVGEDIKAERLARLQQLLITQQTAFNQSKLGAVLPVLFDRQGKKPGQIMGKTAYMQSLYIEGAGQELIGKILPVRVTGAYQNGLAGELCTKQDAVMSFYSNPITQVSA